MPRPTGLARTDGGLSGVSPGTGSFIDVANQAALGAVDNTALAVGELAWVQSYRDWWTLEQSGAALVANQIINAAALPGAGWRWHRSNTPNAYWQRQPAYHVDSTNGNDENPGFAAGASALKSYAEYDRRVAGELLVSQTVTFDVDFAGDIRARNLTNAYGGGPFVLTLQGTETILLDNMVATTVTPTNVSTQTQTTINSVTVPVSWTASGLVGKTAIVKTGAFAGAAFQVQADLGGKTARVTQAIQTGGFQSWGELANGDTFKVVNCTILSGPILVEGPGSIIFQEFQIQVNSLNVACSAELWLFWACIIQVESMYLAGGSFLTLSASGFHATRLSGNGSVLNLSNASSFATYCCVFASSPIITSNDKSSSLGTVIIGGCVMPPAGGGVEMIVSGRVRVVLNGVGGPAPTAGLAVFGVNAAIRMVSVTRGGILDMTTSTVFGVLTGTVPAGFTVTDNGSIIIAATAPNVSAVSPDLALDSINLSWAQVTASSGLRSGAGSQVAVSGGITGYLPTQGQVQALYQLLARQ